MKNIEATKVRIARTRAAAASPLRRALYVATIFGAATILTADIGTTHLTAGPPHSSEKAIPVIHQGGLPPPAVLKSEWPTPGLPGGTNDTVARPRRLSPAPPGDFDIAPLPDYGFQLAPPHTIGPVGRGIIHRPGIDGPDPMIAVGRNFMIASQAGSLVFLDKNGIDLPVKNHIGPRPSVDDIFADFITPGSSTDLNEFAGFPKDCDSPDYPLTKTKNGYCISDFYDLRAYFDAGENRFLLLAHVRNQLFTDIWADENHKNEEYAELGICGEYRAIPHRRRDLPRSRFITL